MQVQCVCLDHFAVQKCIHKRPHSCAIAGAGDFDHLTACTPGLGAGCVGIRSVPDNFILLLVGSDTVDGLGFVKANGAELYSAYLGESERILVELFQKARYKLTPTNR